MDDYPRRPQPPPQQQASSGATGASTAAGTTTAGSAATAGSNATGSQRETQTQTQTQGQSSHLFASSQLPLPHPPVHLQNTRFPPNTHALHPSLSPSISPVYPSQSWPPPPPTPQSLPHPARPRDDYPQQQQQQQHPPRLDIPRPHYHDSRSPHHPHPHPHIHHPHPHSHPHSHPNQQHQHQHQQHQQPPLPSQRTHAHPNSHPPHPASQGTPPSASATDDALPPTSDFVKKLFKMLEDPTFHSVVSWGPEGDCFIVKDMNEFTKTILPKMFKHSNFASFVRQLNKYDFHKVKNAESTPGGDQAWTFRHPDFHAKRRDALENIKRKVPSQRKAQPAATGSGNAAAQSQPAENTVSREEHDNVLERLDELNTRLQETEQAYQNVLSRITAVQENMSQQDGLMQQLIHYFLAFENSKISSPSQPSASQRAQQQSPSSVFSPHANGTAFLQRSETSRLVNLNGNVTEEEVARASFEQMNEISLRAREAGLNFQSNGPPDQSGNSSAVPPVKRESIEVPVAAPRPSKDDLSARRSALESISQEFQRIRTPIQQLPQVPSSQNVNRSTPGFDGYSQTQIGDSKSDSPHQGLQVFTVGHIMPRGVLDESGMGPGSTQSWQYDGSALHPLPALPPSETALNGNATQVQQIYPESYKDGPDSGPSSAPSSDPTSSTSAGGRRPALRVRRSTFVPAWSVPPRVLLVEDDAVSRRLSSKFLQVFGCTIDVAVDGESAVNKMNLEKYDLVLMDIVMPKLDGVAATSLIRKFDPRTPIISMTSNSKPHDIMYYFSQGMNDILPKPFTKEGLLDMLEKHLMHLKVIQAIRNHVPRGVGIPPLSDENFDQALMVASQSHNVLGQQMIGQPNGDDAENDEGRANPFAGMGISDEHYAMILQNLVNGGGPDMNGSSDPSAGHPIPFIGFGVSSHAIGLAEKRPLDDPHDRDDIKRGRFEIIE